MWVSRVRLRDSLAAEAAAAGSVLLATAATYLLWDRLEPTITSLFLVAVTISAWVGGVRGAMLSAALSVLAAVSLSLWLGWPGSLGWASVTWTASFLLVAFLTAALTASRRQARQLLIEQEQRMRLVSAQLPAGLWSTDTELWLTSMFGGGLPVVGGGAYVPLADVFDRAAGNGGAAAEAAHRRALEGKPTSFEIVLHDRAYQAHVEPLRDPQGQIIGVVGVALDITSRKEAEDRIKRAWDQAEHAKRDAEAASRAKDQFLAILSHELRTPLTPALAAATALERNGKLPPEVKEDVEMIRRNIEVEAALIDDLLDVTRAIRGKLDLSRQHVDAHVLIERALEVCRQDIADKRIDLVLDLRAAEHRLLADPARLQQVFWNLIKNAVKFTPAGGRVTVRSLNAPPYLPGQPPRIVVDVVDSGIGIDPEVLPRIFDAFEQGAASITKQFGGLGLGLAISRALVAAHGGRIWAESGGHNRGAAFHVELQTIVEPAPSAAEPALPAPDSGAVERRLRVLFVEDHADTRKLIGRLLGRMGYDIRTAGSVASALDEIETSGPVEVLVSDLSLPDGSGLDLMRQLRERRPDDPMKAIALTGYGMEDDVRQCQEAGFSRHLTKPVNMDVLKEAITQVAGE